jgi:hypothetical protein
LRLPITAGDDKKRNIIRAHPDYRNDGLWLDWVNVSWLVDDATQQNIVLPAQVVMVLDFDSAQYENINPDILAMVPVLSSGDAEVSHYPKHGIHLLVHSAAESNDIDGEVFLLASRYVIEPFFQFIPECSVESVEFVARDPPTVEGNMMDYQISYIKEPKLWGASFVPRCTVNIVFLMPITSISMSSTKGTIIGDVFNRWMNDTIVGAAPSLFDSKKN